jgi:hypothetical protein
MHRRHHIGLRPDWRKYVVRLWACGRALWCGGAHRRDRRLMADSSSGSGEHEHPPLPLGSARGLAGLDDRLGDAPTVTDLVPVLPRPLADRVSLLAVRASGCVGHRRLHQGAASRTRTSACLAGVFDERGQSLWSLSVFSSDRSIS